MEKCGKHSLELISSVAVIIFIIAEGGLSLASDANKFLKWCSRCFRRELALGGSSLLPIHLQPSNRLFEETKPSLEVQAWAYITGKYPRSDFWDVDSHPIQLQAELDLLQVVGRENCSWGVQDSLAGLPGRLTPRDGILPLQLEGTSWLNVGTRWFKVLMSRQNCGTQEVKFMCFIRCQSCCWQIHCPSLPLLASVVLARDFQKPSVSVVIWAAPRKGIWKGWGAARRGPISCGWEEKLLPQAEVRKGFFPHRRAQP